MEQRATDDSKKDLIKLQKEIAAVQAGAKSDAQERRDDMKKNAAKVKELEEQIARLKTEKEDAEI